MLQDVQAFLDEGQHITSQAALNHLRRLIPIVYPDGDRNPEMVYYLMRYRTKGYERQVRGKTVQVDEGLKTIAGRSLLNKILKEMKMGLRALRVEGQRK